LNPATTRILVALLSSLFANLLERGIVSGTTPSW